MPAQSPDEQDVRRLRQLGRDLDDLVADEVLSEGGTTKRLTLLGEGTAAILAGFEQLERATRESVWNLQPLMFFDPEDPGIELNDRSEARGIELAFVTTPNSVRLNPLLGSLYPVTRVGPVFTQVLVVDDRLAVLGGPRAESGAATAWTTTDEDLLGRVREIWHLTVALSEPLVTPGDRLLDRRQLRVACLLAQGETDQAMARRLEVSLRTVEREVRTVLDFLGARSRTEAVLQMSGRGVQGGGPAD